MTGLLGRRAIVIGAGIGGLSIAGALANCFERVEVLERDPLAGSVGSRTGTPQDRHPHALLAGGLRALDELFPGFADDLARAGAVSVGVAQDLQVERPDVGVVPKRDFGFSLLCASRPLIEFVLRRQVEATANIVFRPGSRVTEIVPAETQDSVKGVRVDLGSGRAEMIAADLVVDASGRGALSLGLFDALGWHPPEVTEVGVDISYAMSTGPDLAFPSTRGDRPEKLEEAQQFEAALFRAVVVDPVVQRALTEVGQLLQPQSLLHKPDIMRRIEAAFAGTPA